MSNLYYGNCYASLQTNIKFYIAEPKMPLDNQLQYKSHIIKFISLQAQQTRRTKRKFGHPKSPQPDVTVGNQEAKQPE